ncbi:MAG: hypothetical protein LBM66_02320 [Bifidobacteriaceae bacterium]|jgi:DNA-binding transcriptional regulator YdaS (Cro superfamily)|nr:hypothetical protein [Bifidobacteriaceae bacterium]
MTPVLEEQAPATSRGRSAGPLADARRLRHRQQVDHLDYLRDLRALAGVMNQSDIARELGISQPSVSSALKTAETVPQIPAGFHGASPLEIAQRYAAGEITAETLVDELARWPYKPMPRTDGVDWGLDATGTIAEVEHAAMAGMIEDDLYDQIVDRLERAAQ